jgi:outer membrane usher protein
MVYSLSAAILPAQEKPSAEKIPIAVYIDKTFRGNIPALLEDEDNPGIDRKILISILEEILDDTVLKSLRSEGSDVPETVSPAELRSAGLEADYDSNLLELAVHIPPGLRKKEQISLTTAPGIPLGSAETPAFFSAYMNVQTRGEYFIQWFESGDTESRVPLSLLLQSVSNTAGWVAEGEIFFETYPAYQCTVNYGRLIKDFPENSLRLNAGSLMFPLESMYPAPAALSGIGILRDPSLTFSRRTPLTARREIFLMNPAAVTIIINDQPVRTFRLPPGRHVLGNFPFISGLNAVRIEIREEGLPPRAEEFSVPFDSSLQVHGDYTYFAGIGLPQWETGPPIASAFFRMGVLENLTLGTHLQTGLARGTAGIEALWASPIGMLRTEAGLSAGSDVSPDFGTGFQYRFVQAGRRDLPVAGFGVRYEGKTYLPPESGRKENPFSWQITAVASQSLPGGIGATLGLAYRTGRGEQADVPSANLGITRSFGNGFSLSFNLSASGLPDGGIDWRGGISLSSNPPGGQRSFNLNHNIVDGSASADYQVRPRTPLGSPGYYVSLTGLPYGDSGGGLARGSVTYANEYFEGSLSNTAFRGSDGVPAWANGFSWNAASSAVFSEGYWGISRPVREGFALVVPEESLQDKKVRIYSGNDSGIKTAEKDKPAVISDLREYVPLRLQLDVPELPLEQEANRPERLLTPVYKAGYVIRVGTSPRIFGDGRLVYLDGKPIALQGGEIFSLIDDSFEVQPFFTDEEGIFQFHNLKPGTYRLRLFIHEMAREDMTIPESTEGFFHLGDVTLPVLRKE